MIPIAAHSDVTAKIIKLDTHVELTLCNTLDSKEFTYWGIHVQKLDGDRWTYVRHHLGYPCDAKYRRSSISLEPGKQRTHRWDMKKSKCVNADPGTYRFIIAGEDSVLVLDKSHVFELE